MRRGIIWCSNHMRRTETHQYLPFPPASLLQASYLHKGFSCGIAVFCYTTELQNFFLRNCLKQDFLIFIWMLWKREMPVFQNWISCALIALDLNRNVFTHQSQYEQLSSFKGYHCQQTKSPFLSFLIVPVQKKHIDNQVPVHEAEVWDLFTIKQTT